MQEVTGNNTTLEFLSDKFTPKSELELLVERDMIAEGFDPLNMNDVKEYWRQKGYSVDG